MLSKKERHDLKEMINQALKDNKWSQGKVKEDKTIVTEIDLLIHNKIGEIIGDRVNFFSEEKKNQFNFPAVILDPIDGTMELSQGIAECALSYCFARSSKIIDAEAWIYNPFTGFEIDSEKVSFKAPRSFPSPLLGLVSRSEWSKGLYNSFTSNQNIILSPRGSVAYKLGLLAAGACDFVISLKEKNIWDLAAGTTLWLQSGGEFYYQGKKQEYFSEELYRAPMIWCKSEQDYQAICKHFSL